MTDTEFAGSLRAAEAFRGGLQRQAERPIFRPLDVADLTDRGRPPPLGPWPAASFCRGWVTRQFRQRRWRLRRSRPGPTGNGRRSPPARFLPDGRRSASGRTDVT